MDSSFIPLLLLVALLPNQSIKVSSAQITEGAERDADQKSADMMMQNEAAELALLKKKNVHDQDKTIDQLKSQLKDHEDRIFHLEKKLIKSHSLPSPKSLSTNNHQRNSRILFNRKIIRKRPVRLLYNRLSPNKNEGDDTTKRMPTSCADLNSIGHTLNAFYVVKDNVINSTKLQTVYCDFQNSPASSTKSA